MRIYKLCGALALLLVCGASFAQAAAPSAAITITAPTTYADGTPIPSTVPITYNLYQGTSATTLVKVASGLTTLTTTVTTGLVDGQTYFWAVTAVAGGLEGAKSNVASKVFAAVPPGSVTITVQ
jgi:hypothetical protein